MQTSSPVNSSRSPTRALRHLNWFFTVPVSVIVLFSLLVALLAIPYRQQHENRIFTGVSVWGADLSGLSREQAERQLSAAFDYARRPGLALIDPTTYEEWRYAPSELGLALNEQAVIDAAYNVGRQGGPFERLRQQFQSWYYGWPLTPIFVIDEAKLDQKLVELAGEINRPPADAALAFDGSNVGFVSATAGRNFDIMQARNQLLMALTGLQGAEIELIINDIQPRIQDTSEAAEHIQNLLSGPMVLYLQEPLQDVDLERVSIPEEQLVKWIRVHTNTQNAKTEVIVDRNAFIAWLRPYLELIRRDPVNARFYFDDNTRELVLVEPHVNGRELDVEATADLFVDRVLTGDRTMPFILRDIVPVVHSGASAEELGITELVSESTTWFFGSSDERMHNIARAASNFYGIAIAPGEEFSFNHFLGEVSAEQGYDEGLIIFGGRTIKGVGGGVCQVSTTVFQAAFWAGYPITERWEHGYRVGYYDDGEGPGMDATVYSPLVDFRFINDTPYYLLIENYYSEANSSLTFKFYSTGLGRTIEKTGPVIENVVPPRPDIWEFNEELETDEIEQVDWAVEGADVTVGRTVYNASGDLLRQDTFVSNYIPWQNIYQYGPGTDINPETQAPEETESQPEPAESQSDSQ